MPGDGDSQAVGFRAMEGIYRVELQGMTWYRFQDVLDALGVDARQRKTASRLVDMAHKRYIWQFKRTRSGGLYYDKRYCYVDTAGIERLVIRFGGKRPRAMLMEMITSAEARG